MQKTLLDRTSPSGRALLLLTPLIQSIEGFANAVAERNAWIAEFKAIPENNSQLKTALYFGIPYSAGHIDDRYPTLMEAIEFHTDSCIAFSILLVNVLKEHGEKLAAEYGKSAPKISKPNFEMAGDLIPDMKQFSPWVDDSKSGLTVHPAP